MSNLYNYIRGQNILTITENSNEPIIEGVLYDGQYVLFTAEEKIGKTVLSQQLTCCLSTGNSLFNTFSINKTYKVWYMFNEVNINELKDRFIRMSRGIGINTGNVTLIPFRFHFNTPTGKEQLDKIVEENKDNLPDVIILDCLYKAITGSLKDDNIVNDFNHTFGEFATKLGGASRIVIHHLNKPSKDDNGKFRKRTDKDTYGSAFITADVDHVFRLEKWGSDPKTKERALKCETQRSGDIIDIVRLVMLEPDPLYYDIVSIHSEEKVKVLKLLGTKMDVR